MITQWKTSRWQKGKRYLPVAKLDVQRVFCGGKHSIPLSKIPVDKIQLEQIRFIQIFSFRLAVVFSCLLCSCWANEFCMKTANNSHFPGIFSIGLVEVRNTLLIYYKYLMYVMITECSWLHVIGYYIFPCRFRLYLCPPIHPFVPSFLCSFVDIQNFPSHAISCDAFFSYPTWSGRRLWRSLPPQTVDFNRAGLKLGIIYIRGSSREREN